jgi:recombination protein RecA
MRRITEITGPASIGKTTLSFNIIREAQEMGMKTLFADVEWTFKEEHALMCGVDLDKLDLLLSRYSEECLDEIVAYVQKHKNALVVIDSIGGLHSRDEGEKKIGERVIGHQAGLVSKFCRKIVPLIAIQNVALVVINHEITDIMTGVQKTSGGEKLTFHKSLWIKLKAKMNSMLKQGDVRVGEVVIAQIRKNKMGGLRHAECEMRMIYGKGFSPEADLLADAIEKGTITKKGNGYFFKDTRIGIGMSKTRKALEEDPALLEVIKAALANREMSKEEHGEENAKGLEQVAQ